MSRNLLVGKNPSGVYEPVVVDADGRIKMDLAAVSHSSDINVNVQNASIATTGAAKSVTQTQVMNAVSIADSSKADSTGVDISTHDGAISIYGITDNLTGDGFVIEYSHDDSTYYGSSDKIYVNDDGDFAASLTGIGVKYIRISKKNTSGSAEIVTAYLAVKA